MVHKNRGCFCVDHTLYKPGFKTHMHTLYVFTCFSLFSLRLSQPLVVVILIPLRQEGFFPSSFFHPLLVPISVTPQRVSPVVSHLSAELLRSPADL